jgi:hypothetical protein
MDSRQKAGFVGHYQILISKKLLLLNGRFEGNIEGSETFRNNGKYLPQNKA